MTGVRIDVLTLFPEAFAGPLDVSILRRARAAGLFSLHLHDIREHAPDPHHQVDDYPFGGGQGMVLRADILDAAWRAMAAEHPQPPHTIYLSPAGQVLDDRLARELATYPRLAFVCGRYEGVDQRFIDRRVDREVSMGDFVLTGGELPAMVCIDALVRHIPGALGDAESPEDESFADGLLEHPQYTRPASFEGMDVPRELLGGSHEAIARWKNEQRLARTAARRPDLLPAVARVRLAESRIPGVGRIREVRWPDDFPALRALWEAGGYDLAPQDAAGAVAALVNRNPSLALVAEAGKAKPQLLGAVLAGWDGRVVTIHRLAVAAPHRRRGVARALVAELELRLRTLGCSEVIVRETPAGEAAPFLASAGFQASAGASWTKTLG